ncbi:MAG: RNA 2',3'-cyclic phosphodiesterase [Patescibacteria group bacterium]|jgi:2'-5' RNA ligase
MEYLRLFISVPVDIGLAKKIHKQFTALDLPWDSMRLVLPEQMHITLKFFSAVPLDKLPEIISTLESIKTTGQGLDLTLEQVMVTPLNHPEVISMRLQANQELSNLYNAIEQALFSAGLANLESRKFNPHLTLARIKKRVEPAELASLATWKTNNFFSASYFSLMQSELTPRGPIYTTLQDFEL